MKKLSLSFIFILSSIIGTFAQSGTKLEAENANYVDCTVVSDSKYSGGKALQLTEGTAKITFDFTALEKGKYTIYTKGEGIGGEKEVSMTANSTKANFKLDNLAEVEVGTFFLAKGSNEIVITPSWTWFRIDYIRIEKSNSPIPFNISSSPVDPQASVCAKTLYSFLYNNFGKKTISGIMTGDMKSANGNVTQHDDVKAVYQASGKYPALVGFDFMNATGKDEATSYSKDYTNDVIELAKDTWQRGGIPAITWHWRDPSRSTGEFYSANCSVKISDAMKSDGSWNTSSTLYQNIIKDIDAIADHFLTLQNAGIACIFRPLHEASGGWFWWGRDKKAAHFIKLYHLVYDRMVNVKGVHNVIWVWNAGEYDQDWDPGEAYYDVVSADIYNPDFDYSSNYVTFDNLKKLTSGKKILALSENGPIPDIDKEFDEEAVWSWWMPWYQTWEGKFVDKTSKEEWTKCMSDERVVTLEDLSAGWDAYTSIKTTKVSNQHSDQAIYDLNGHRLSRIPSRGLYIQGGKIFISKHTK